MKTSFLIALFFGSVALVSPVFGTDAATAATPTTEPVATSSATPLTREKLLAAVGQQLIAHFNLEGDLDLDLLRAWTAPAQVSSDWNVAVVEYPLQPTSSMLVRCRIQAGSAGATDVTLMLRASLWREVWVTRTQLVANSMFDPAQLETRRVDCLRERDTLAVTVGDHSYIFARGVPPGRLLSWRDIARRPLVRKGDLVEVSAVDGLLVVTMKAIAMENGGQGDRVTVRNPDSRKDFAAMVIDENHVQVRF